MIVLLLPSFYQTDRFFGRTPCTSCHADVRLTLAAMMRADEDGVYCACQSCGHTWLHCTREPEIVAKKSRRKPQPAGIDSIISMDPTHQ